MARPKGSGVTHPNIRFDKSVVKTKKCWLWKKHISHSGYGRFYSGEKAVFAHRFSFERYKYPIPYRLNVLHKCDTPRCVNPKHLYVGTQKDNVRDMLNGNRNKFGENHYASKLTSQQVREIRKRYKNGESFTKLGKIYNVNRKHIWQIGTYKRWKQVP